MSTNTRKTAVDLSSSIGLLVIADLTGLLIVNNVPGGPVLGVLTKVYTYFGEQFGEFTDGPTIVGAISDASVIVVASQLEAGALGKVTKRIGGTLVGIAIAAGIGDGKALLMQPLQSI